MVEVTTGVVRTGVCGESGDSWTVRSDDRGEGVTQDRLLERWGRADGKGLRQECDCRVL